ncbi:unnamed protein product [Lampetra fluviatilis]
MIRVEPSSASLPAGCTQHVIISLHPAPAVASNERSINAASSVTKPANAAACFGQRRRVDATGPCGKRLNGRPSAPIFCPSP